MSIERYTLRPLFKKDIQVVIRLADELRLSHWSDVDYREEIGLDDSVMLVCTDDDAEVTGFIVGRIVPSNDADGGIEGEIYNIGVNETLQRTGCGRKLLKEFLNICKERSAKAIWLEVRESNSSAIRFYESFGFTVNHVRPRFYSDPVESGLTMRLEL